MAGLHDAKVYIQNDHSLHATVYASHVPHVACRGVTKGISAIT